MNGRPTIEEKYIKDTDVINYVVYKSTTGQGNDEVLQHKLFDTTETAHITLHPDGTVNLRVKRTDSYLKNAVDTRLMDFIDKASNKI